MAAKRDVCGDGVCGLSETARDDDPTAGCLADCPYVYKSCPVPGSQELPDHTRVRLILGIGTPYKDAYSVPIRLQFIHALPALLELSNTRRDPVVLILAHVGSQSELAPDWFSHQTHMPYHGA